MQIAVMQAQAAVLDIDANLAAIDAAAQRAVAQGAELLLTPELFVVGYAPYQLRDELEPAILPETRARLAEIAVSRGIALVYSLPEISPSGWKITATFIDETGARLGHYEKVHLFGEEEKDVFVPGDQPATIVDFRGLRLGMVICFDVEFPETVRAAALRGAQGLLVPTAMGAGYEAVCTTLVPTRAMESQMYIAYANHCGSEAGFQLAGTSVVAGPDGTVLARATADADLLFADFDPQLVASARAEIPYLADRRPELYERWDG